MCRVRMVVDTTVENGGCVFANSGSDECFSTGMFSDEISHVVDYTCDGDESATILGFGLVIVPADDWELFKGNTPIEGLALLVELLLELLEAALFDLILFELLQVIGESELLPDPDGPFCGIVLMPFDSIAIV